PPGMPKALLSSSPAILAQPVWQSNGPPYFGPVCSVTAVGYGPLTYQWTLNGTNIDRATNSTLAYSPYNFRSGTYNVIISDSYSTNTSADAVLNMVENPPFIYQQPTNRTVLAGATAAFTVSAMGIDPLIWQWQFNQTNIDGATNAALVLTNIS